MPSLLWKYLLINSNNLKSYKKIDSTFANFLNVRGIHSGLQTMTSQEVAIALRPFIFVIHPDRFWNHPKEIKDTNEISLKRLNQFLGDKLSQTLRTTPIKKEETITFYMRPNETKTALKNDLDKIGLKKIDIKLNGLENINTTVHKILSECSLSTDYLNKIGKQPHYQQKNATAASSMFNSKNHQFYRRGNEYFYSKDLFDEMFGEDATSEESKINVELNLSKWLKQNHSSALTKLEASRPIRTDLLRLKQELIEEFGLYDLRWQCDWSVSHIRGGLKNLKILSKHYPEDMKKLRAKTVVFSRHQSCVSFNGLVVFSIEDVRNSWLHLIRSIKSYDFYVANLPSAETELSDLLCNISIVHPEYSLWNAEKYFNQLKRLTKSIYEFKAQQGFPSNWPETLEDYQLIVEFDSGPLMLSPNGNFIVPASCPVSLLVRFINENLLKASQILKNGDFQAEHERIVRKECQDTFGIECLEKDLNITSEQMIGFCRRLLNNQEKFSRTYLNGTHVRVSMYYSVMHDGQICLPFDFIL